MCLASFVIALAHFSSEFLIYGTCKFTTANVTPLMVASACSGPTSRAHGHRLLAAVDDPRARAVRALSSEPDRTTITVQRPAQAQLRV